MQALQKLPAVGVVFAFDDAVLGSDLVLSGRADELIHFEHGAEWALHSSS